MTIGASLFTIGVGAVLAFAVTAEVAGIDLQIVGYVCWPSGCWAFVIGLWAAAGRRRGAAPPPPGY